MGNLPGRKHKDSRELEKYTKPTGLYAACKWEDKAVRKLILDQRLAPRLPGSENRNINSEECPICLMFYPEPFNRTSCCNKVICTECYLQIKPPKTHVLCPFCNKEKFKVVYYTCKRSKKKCSKEILENPTHINSSDQASPVLKDVTIQYATADDRNQIHNEVRVQCEFGDAYGSFLQSVPEEVSPGGSAWFSMIHSIETSQDAVHVEELMVLEAMKQSILDQVGTSQASTMNDTQEDNYPWSTRTNYTDSSDVYSSSDTISVNSVTTHENQTEVRQQPSRVTNSSDVQESPKSNISRTPIHNVGNPFDDIVLSEEQKEVDNDSLTTNKRCTNSWNPFDH